MSGLRYVTTGGPYDKRDWYQNSHEAMITRHVRALWEEARELKKENLSCMERIGRGHSSPPSLNCTSGVCSPCFQSIQWHLLWLRCMTGELLDLLALKSEEGHTE